MKIGIVTHYFPPYIRGGANLSVYYLAKGLRERGMEVEVFASRPPNLREGGHMEVTLDIEDYRIFDDKTPKNVVDQDLMSAKMAIQLRRKLKKLNEQFDVLHSYGMDAIPAIWFNKKYSKIIAASANENWATCPFEDHWNKGKFCMNCDMRKLSSCSFSKTSGNFLRKTFAIPYLYTSMKMRRYIVKKLDWILPISQSIRNLLIQNGFDSGKMRVCYNMLDPKDYEDLNRFFLHDIFGLDHSIRIVLYAGRLASYKGVEYLMKAVPEVVTDAEDVIFVFLGHGDMKEKLLNLSKELGVGDKVIVGGFIDPKNMPDSYASSYCTVLPSTWPEPFARVPIEALASGTAIIATDIGGTPEVVIHEKTGLLIAPFNLEEISGSLQLLLNNKHLRDELVKNGRELVIDRHSIEVQINNYIDAYEAVS